VRNSLSVAMHFDAIEKAQNSRTDIYDGTNYSCFDRAGEYGSKHRASEGSIVV
jgi:hypothetical protein